MPSTPTAPQDIQTALSHLPGWEIVERTPTGADQAHTEIHRRYKFASFKEAMSFMQTAAVFIDESDHHPTWLNTYATLEIWITTFELEHKLSMKDFALAHYLEGLYKEMNP